MSNLRDEIASTEPWYRHDRSARDELKYYIAAQMAKGGLYAAYVFFGGLIFIGLLRLLAGILPEDPYAAAEMIQKVAQLTA